MTRLLAYPIILVITVPAVLWLTQRRMMYFPAGDVPPPAAVGLPQAQAVTFPTEDGLTLGGWFVPAAGPSLATVIVFNGNAGHRAYRAEVAARLAAHGLAVLLFDYRGYGDNPGSPTEEGLARDARAARQYVLSRADVDPQRLVYFGESLGSGVAVRLAAEHGPHAMILRSPYTSFADMGRHHYFRRIPTWMFRDRFPSIDRIARIGCPLLVIAGTADTVVPVSQSQQLFQAAREPKRLLILEGADHNDEALAAGPRVVEGILDFLRTIRPDKGA